MRQGQQNRRGRGRNNNNNNNQGRKGQNPLTRSFESTGPDIKIRGTPAHIAEKYMALARDAQSSGDPVLAENYLQHAEHYNRIIMTYREQQMLQNGGEMPNGAARPASPAGFGEDDEEGDFSSEQPQASFGQQPRGEGRHDDRGHRGGHDGGGRSFGRDRDRGERFQRSDRQDRDRGERVERADRPERSERPERIERAERPDRAPQPDIGIEGGQPPPRRERDRDRQPLPHDEQPAFLRRPVRRQRREAPAEEAAEPTPAVESSGE